MSAPPFADPHLPLDRRLDDLLARLTLAEKVSLLHQRQPAIPRLGLRHYVTGTEALHGLAWHGPATVFPQAIGLASSWNPDLVRRVGSAVGDEVRGLHHRDPASTGLNVWAPVVNLLRDPRWGRNEEGYSEDPLLTGIMATAYSRGLRGEHPRYLKTAPTLKHFLGYNNETDRDTTSSSLRPRVLHEYELPAYRPAIASGTAVAIMPSYNLVNGRPAHLSPLLELVRSWAPQRILIVSDAYAPSNVAGSQAYHPSHPEAHAALLEAGLDSFTDHDADSSFTTEHVTAALRGGLVDEADVDRAVRDILAVRFRLGEFDPPEQNPYTAITERAIDSPEHRVLAREAAQQAVVLLKNHRDTLPLAASTSRAAVVGPLADTVCEDWYSGTLPYAVTPAQGVRKRLGGGVAVADGADRVALKAAGRYVTAPAGPDGGVLVADADTPGPEQTFAVLDWGQGVCTLRAESNRRYVSLSERDALVNDQLAPNGWTVRETFQLLPRQDGGCLLRHVATGRYVVVGHTDGTLVARASADQATRFRVEVVERGADAAAAAARDAEVAIVVVGNHPLINGRETQDRADICLPDDQRHLIRSVVAANPRTVLVVVSSYPQAIGWEHDHVPAIVWSSHGGQELGHALADVLFGDVSPAGRLTQTWYRSTDELPGILDYDIITAGTTYLYFTGTPLYPFGHGLSYTSFGYRDLRLSAETVAADGEVTVSVEVSNTGERTGDEVVQLYTRQLTSRVRQPVKTLRGFNRVRLAPGEATRVTFPLRAADLAFWDVSTERFVTEAARHEIMVGPSSAEIARTATLTVDGERLPPRTLTGKPLRADSFDRQHGVSLIDADLTSETAVTATAPGSWIAFDDVDLDPTTGTFCALVSAPDGDGGSVELRLDDQVSGPPIATLIVPHTPGRHRWVQARTPVRLPSGPHNLYLVFTAPGVNLHTCWLEP